MACAAVVAVVELAAVVSVSLYGVPVTAQEMAAQGRPRLPVDDIALIVDGNYVRAKTYSGKSADLEKLRQFLTDSGAKGVTIIAQPDTGVTRTASTVKAGASIEVSVSDYIKSADFENKEELDKACQAVLAEARMEIA